MITFDDFHDRIGDEFRAETSAGSVSLRLTGCQATGPNGDTSSFSLTFSSESDKPIEQNTYQLTASGFGPELIFLVPVGLISGGAEYQAVFHRLPD